MDGRLYAVAANTGAPMWSFDAGGPVFAAPCVAAVAGAAEGAAAEEVVLFTSQAGRLFCARASDGALRWARPAEVHGHSSPSTDVARAQGRGAAAAARVVCVGAVDGSLHAFAASDGAPLASRRLPGAIFSSPVLCASRALVGCRDDHLYCVELRGRRDAAPAADGVDERRVAALRRLLGRG